MPDFEPLPHEWMLISIIGFFVSWLYIYGHLGVQYAWAVTWGFTFMLFFIILFIATVVNMSQSSLHDQHLEELAVHEIRKR